MKKIHPINNLFYRSIKSFQLKSEGYPIRFNQCIALWFYRIIDEFDFDVHNDEKVIRNYLDWITSGTDSWEELIAKTYYNILYIDKLFLHHIDNQSDYYKLMKELAEDEQNDIKEFWIFDLPHKMVLSLPNFKETLSNNFELWLKCTKRLRNACEKIVLFKPFDEVALNMTYVLNELTLSNDFHVQFNKWFESSKNDDIN